MTEQAEQSCTSEKQTPPHNVSGASTRGQLTDRAFSFGKRLIAIKSFESLEEEGRMSNMRRELNVWDLTFVGIGGIIGTGIFVLTGHAAAINAGPAVVISFIISGLAAGLAALSYSEMAAMIPAAGSAYTYSYATMGELVAWIIGWDLILEYLVGAATVAVGWSGYFVSFFQVAFGLALGKRFTSPPLHWNESTLSITRNADAIINLPGAFIILLLTLILCLGIRESKWTNNFIIVIKLFIIILFICAGIKFINPANWTPFVPPAAGDGDWRHYGVGGIFAAAQSVFFAYIGFDAVSTTAQEAKRPEKDMPVGILLSLAICTVLYIGTALVLTGIVPYWQLNVEAPVAFACEQTGMKWLVIIVTLGALFGLTSVALISLLSQPRIFHAMACDGLLPSIFARVHPRFQTPWVPTLASGALASVLAAFLPIDLLGNMTSVGTLLAFLLVHIGVIVLRFTRPNIPRRFKIPGPGLTWMVVPVVGVVVSVLLIAVAEKTTIWRLFAWMAIGLIVYAVYGYRKSSLRKLSE